AAVTAVIVVGAVAVFLAIGLIVLVVVFDQVFQRETVVTSDEVDAGVRPPSALFIQVAAAAQSRREFRYRAAVALPKAADVVAVFAVPLRPQNGEVAHLVAALADIPRLRDQ